MRLLTFDDNQLQSHHDDHDHTDKRVSLPVHEVTVKELQVKRHKALDGKQSSAKVNWWTLAAPLAVAVNDLWNPKRRIQEQKCPITLQQCDFESASAEATNHSKRKYRHPVPLVEKRVVLIVNATLF